MILDRYLASLVSVTPLPPWHPSATARPLSPRGPVWKGSAWLHCDLVSCTLLTEKRWGKKPWRLLFLCILSAGARNSVKFWLFIPLRETRQELTGGKVNVGMSGGKPLLVWRLERFADLNSNIRKIGIPLHKRKWGPVKVALTSHAVYSLKWSLTLLFFPHFIFFTNSLFFLTWKIWLLRRLKYFASVSCQVQSNLCNTWIHDLPHNPFAKLNLSDRKT